MIIERLKPCEIQEAKKLLSDTWKDTYGKYYSKEAIEKITTNWHSPKLLLQQAKDKNFYFAVAKIDKKIVGLITVKQLPDKTLFLLRLYVHPNHQGLRIGSKLLDSAIRYFPDAEKMKLECEEQNGGACSFYISKGFRQIGKKDEIIEGVKITNIEFEKIFG